MTAAISLAAVLLAARPAAGQPSAPPPSPPSRSSLGDPCREGLGHERAGALPRAFLELTRCAADKKEGAGGADAGADATAALGRVKRKLAAGKFAPVSFSLTPPEAELRIAPFTDGAPLRDPHALWLPFGKHTYVATAPGRSEVRGEVVVDSPARILLRVELEPLQHARPPGSVDFEADGPAVDEPIVVADPKPKKLPSLIPRRFRGGLDGAHGSGTPTSGTSETRRRSARSWPWILTRGL